MKEVYITGVGAFLPNKPISNEHIEDYLGLIKGKSSRVKERILNQNGIKQRHFAMDRSQKSTHTNAEMAAAAIEAALQHSQLYPGAVDMIATGTTQGDLPVPGFASAVHAASNLPPCELASFQSVCASGLMAAKHAYAHIKAGDVESAAVVGSEFASRLFKSTRFEAQCVEDLPFDTEFLRWMLSDGAGAFAMHDRPNPSGLSLRVQWIDLKSHASDYPLCMYTGRTTNSEDSELTWLDYPDYESASKAGAINLRQDVRLLKKVVQVGVAHYFELIDQGRLTSAGIDWLCCHYSSEIFVAPIKELMEKGGGAIPDERWFSNLSTKGNTGAASIFIMLEELVKSGRLKPGQQILCMVPESGRFITSFMMLEVVGSSGSKVLPPLRKLEAPDLTVLDTPDHQWLVRQLAQTWISFETQLMQTPIFQKMQEGKLQVADYKLLLHDLRQQVVDGSQWISRAASNLDMDHFDLRSAFITHAATEHRDYQMLEKNYAAMGWELEDIRSGVKNVGSQALTSYIFQQASKPNPVDLLGAMYIIEGIGKRLAGYWGEMIKNQLQLSKNQVSFFTYHGVADENHFERLEEAVNSLDVDNEHFAAIARTAKIVSKLYLLQMNELGNY